MPMTRNDIADYLGLNPNVVSRTLKGLRQVGQIVYLSKTELLVPDLTRLCEMTPVATGLMDCYGNRGSEAEAIGSELFSASSVPDGCPMRNA